MRTVYKYEIWHDGSCIIDRAGYDDTEFESYEEANEEALDVAEDKIQEWKDDNCWDGETLEDFDIRIIDMEVEDDDEF